MSLSDWLWTAPEILRLESGKKAGSPQADVYSFSIIVSEVLTHDEPFAMFPMEPRGHFYNYIYCYFLWHYAFMATVLGSSGNEGQVSLSWIIKTKLYESFTNSTKWCKFIQHLWWSGNVKLFHCNMFTKAFHNFDHWLKEIVQLCDEICTRVGRLRKKCVKERDVKSISVEKCAKMRYLRTLTH